MRKQASFAGRMAVVCGGSKGIGRATAAEIVRRGGSVAIVARGAEALGEARDRLQGLVALPGQFVEGLQADATDELTITKVLEDFVAERGTPDYLINSVGFARPGYATELSPGEYRDQMEGNYYGQLFPTLGLLPHMIAAGRGHIAFVSSMLGFFGIVGYAAYAPAKHAIAGLADALRHELKPLGIGVSVVFPPDVDTPGFAEENRTKPAETAMLSANVELARPEAVARVFVDGIGRSQYHIIPGGARRAWWLQRYVPTVVRMVIDRDLRKARRRIGQK